MSLITTQCPAWEYETVPGWSVLLAQRAMETLIRLRQLTPAAKIIITQDGRPVHQRYFYGLTPAGCGYYAGHYRGESFTCLRDYEVGIPGDPMVGHAPNLVQTAMQALSADLFGAISDADFVWSVNQQIITPAEKLYRVIQLGVAMFVYFLQIHPYANGNGHLARFFLIAFLGRYNIFPARWPLHPRPPDPPYSELIGRYRRGDRTSLERFVLSCI